MANIAKTKETVEAELTSSGPGWTCSIVLVVVVTEEVAFCVWTEVTPLARANLVVASDLAMVSTMAEAFLAISAAMEFALNGKKYKGSLFLLQISDMVDTIWSILTLLKSWVTW